MKYSRGHVRGEAQASERAWLRVEKPFDSTGSTIPAVLGYPVS
jgi:hypothetical protein